MFTLAVLRGGYFLRKYKLINILLKHSWLFSLSLLSYMTLVCLYVGGLHRVYIVMGLFAIVPFVYVFKQREGLETVLERELARIGRGSLDIYVLHYFFINIIHLNPFGVWLSETHNYLIEALFALTLSVVIAYMCIFAGAILHKSDFVENVIYGKFASRVKILNDYIQSSER